MLAVDIPLGKDMSVEIDQLSAEGRLEAGSSKSQSDQALERKTVLKLDLLLVPMMCMIYLLAFLDRANIGNARVAGLQKDLGITDHQYQTGKIVSPHPHLKVHISNTS
jgi:hypothetical protein